MTTPRVKETSPAAHAQEGSLGVTNGGAPPHNKCGHTPIGFCGGIHLSKKLRMHVGEGPRAGQVWQKKPDNWPKVNKDPEGLSYGSDSNHLVTELLLIREDAHTLSLWVCISALLLT